MARHCGLRLSKAKPATAAAESTRAPSPRCPAAVLEGTGAHLALTPALVRVCVPHRRLTGRETHPGRPCVTPRRAPPSSQAREFEDGQVTVGSLLLPHTAPP